MENQSSDDIRERVEWRVGIGNNEFCCNVKWSCLSNNVIWNEDERKGAKYYVVPGTPGHTTRGYDGSCSSRRVCQTRREEIVTPQCDTISAVQNM